MRNELGIRGYGRVYLPRKQIGEPLLDVMALLYKEIDFYIEAVRFYYIICLLSRAFTIVILSAYSISEPIGRPYAIRETLTSNGDNSFEI